MKSKFFSTWLVLFLSVIISKQIKAFETITMSPTSGLFTAEEQSIALVKTNYVAWDKNWAWYSPKVATKFKNSPSMSATFTGDIQNFGMTFDGSIHQKVAHTGTKVDWNYNWSATKPHPDAIGVGIDFNLNFESPSFISGSFPVLKENGSWSWVTKEGTIEVTFKPAIAKLFFDRNNKRKIRALFFKGIVPGSSQITMSVSVTKAIPVLQSSDGLYDPVKLSEWRQSVLPENVSPVDMSFLNKDMTGKIIPAGSHGPITANKDQLFFADGTPAKFWGINLIAYSLFSTSDENIAVHAKRIAQLGFNLVRIHHHDSEWVNPNIFQSRTKTLTLSKTSLEKLDKWIKALKDNGVYIWMDMQVGRAYKPDDGIDNYTEIQKTAKNLLNNTKPTKKSAEYGSVKGFDYYNQSIQAKMKQFNQNYLNHINPYTGIAYKNDPAVIGILVTNEDDLSTHLGKLFASDNKFPAHYKLFKKDAFAFADKWKLSREKTTLPMLPGDAKLYLSDVEHRFNQTMMSAIDTLGYKSLVATTSSWGKMPLFGLASLTDGSIIDTHSYGYEEELSYNPRFNPSFLNWIAASQVTDKPLSVSEWNNFNFLVTDRFTIPLYTASIAALQGWDAMMFFGYSQSSLDRDKKDAKQWECFNDPSLVGLMPASALLYRQGHVSEAKKTYQLTLDKNQFFYNRVDPIGSKTIRTLMETSKLTVGMPVTSELPWLQSSKKSSDVIPVNDTNIDFIPAGQNYVESDTLELKRDWVDGVQTINTQKSQVISGWVGGKSINLQDTTFNISTRKAVVSVQSLQNTPVSKSTQIFVTAIARSQPIADTKLPFMSEPVKGSLNIAAVKGLKLYSVSNTGASVEKPTALSYDKTQGKYTINLDMAGGYWLILKAQ